MKHNLLIVDDSEKVRKSLIDWLYFYCPNCHINAVASGEEAINMVREQEIDIVLMDINMPGMDGIEATRQIKFIAPSIPVVIITIHDQLMYREEAQAAGADAFIPKGMVYKDLMPLLYSLNRGNEYGGFHHQD